MFCIFFEFCEKKVGLFGHLPGNILLTSTLVNNFVTVPADSVGETVSAGFPCGTTDSLGENHDAKVHLSKRKNLLQWTIVGG